jgi:hypothetical protein
MATRAAAALPSTISRFTSNCPPLPATSDRFRARVVNMVRQESGESVSVTAELQDEYGATPHEAFSKIEAAVEQWVKDQTASH